MRHELKCWPDEFQATCRGQKTAEFRRDDRGFAVGDGLLLCEWDPTSERYTGGQLYVTVMHIERGPDFGIPEGYVMMSIVRGS